MENVRFWLDPLPPPVSVRTLWMVPMVSPIWDSCRKKKKFNQNYLHCAPPHPIYIKKKDYERCSSGNPFFHDWDSRLQYLIYGDYSPGNAFWVVQVGVHRVVEGLRHALKPLSSSALSKIYSIFYGNSPGGNSPGAILRGAIHRGAILRGGGGFTGEQFSGYHFHGIVINININHKMWTNKWQQILKEIFRNKEAVALHMDFSAYANLT